MSRCWADRARGSRISFPGRPSSSSCPCRACTKSTTSSKTIMSHEGRPDFKSPQLGCDCHFHVFGPAGRYPHNQVDLRYAPPAAPVEDFLALAGKLGIGRFVFVQPSAYGRDNRCMLDAMRKIGAARCRGIVDIDENAPDAEFERLDALGARCAEIGWQLDFLTPGWLTSELMPVLSELDVDFTIAHFGMFPAMDGVEQPGFRQLLDLVRRGRCYVKLTGVYRMSVAKGFADVAPMARALIEAAADRVIWGSDYPHLSFAEKVGSIELWNLLGKWAPEETLRRRILVDNPQRLFKF